MEDLPQSQNSLRPHVVVHGDRSRIAVVHQVGDHQEWIFGFCPRHDLPAVASKP